MRWLCRVAKAFLVHFWQLVSVLLSIQHLRVVRQVEGTGKSLDAGSMPDIVSR